MHGGNAFLIEQRALLSELAELEGALPSIEVPVGNRSPYAYTPLASVVIVPPLTVLVVRATDSGGATKPV